MKKSEAIFWSIALPGFAQLLNKNYVKGILFVFLEFVINVQANINEIIMLSFLGEIQTAIERTDYQWLLFYPCLYFFAMWDAYRSVGGGKEPYSFLPLVFAAFTVTVGTMYSPKLTIFNVLFGPVWIAILFVIPGLILGYILQKVIIIIQKGKVSVEK